MEKICEHCSKPYIGRGIKYCSNKCKHEALSIDLTGLKIGNITVLGFSHTHKTKRASTRMWKCICVCGKTYLVKATHLISGKVTQCKQCADSRYKIALSLKEDYFEKWSRNMAYILGFIYADGCIYHKVDGNSNESYALIIKLSSRDIDVLEFIKQEIAPGANLTNNTDSNMSTFRVSNNNLCLSLINRGIIPNKTYDSHTLPSVPKQFMPDFIRGYIDGDGCFFKRKSSIGGSCIVVSKNQGNVNDIQKFFKFGSVTEANPGKFNIYRYQAYGKNVIKIGNIIYKNKDQSFYLQRKYDKFQEIVRSYQKEPV